METKVKCPHCGTEFDVLAEHEHIATGLVLGKDSERGDIYLPTNGRSEPRTENEPIHYIQSNNNTNTKKNNNMEKMNQSERIAMLEAMGFCMDDFKTMLKGMGMKIVPDGEDESREYSEEEQTIKARNWTENMKLFRRYLPAATLDLLFGEFGWLRCNHRWSNEKGYHFTQWLHSQPCGYEWRVLIKELNAMDGMQKHGDYKNLEIRSVIWNKDVVLRMLQELKEALEQYIKTSKVHNYFDREHGKTIKYYKMVGCRNYCPVDKVQEKIYAPIDDVYMNVMNVDMSKKGCWRELQTLIEEFYKVRERLPMSWNESRAFANAFKMAGGYYTADDFLKFNGWKMYTHEYTCWGNKVREMSRNEALDYLNRKLHECADSGEGYKMLGLLKQLAEDNNFDYEATKQKWAEERRNK